MIICCVVLSYLLSGLGKGDDKELRDAEARRNAVHAIAAVVETVGVTSSTSSSSSSSKEEEKEEEEEKGTSLLSSHLLSLSGEDGESDKGSAAKKCGGGDRGISRGAFHMSLAAVLAATDDYELDR